MAYGEYDGAEKIAQCLSCAKAECDNCLAARKTARRVRLVRLKDYLKRRKKASSGAA